MIDSPIDELRFRNSFFSSHIARGLAVSMYSDVVMEHFESPRNTGVLDAPDAIGTCNLGGRGPSMQVCLKMEHDIVVTARFKTHGCGFSIAAGSLLTVLVTGKTVAECRALCGEDLNTALGGLPAHKRFCADLAIGALHDALAQIPTT